jgi:hypothetical protein
MEWAVSVRQAKWSARTIRAILKQTGQEVNPLENEAGTREGEELQGSSSMQSTQNERQEAPDDAANQQVLAYIPSQEKLEFGWMPTNLIREGRNGTKIIQGNNKRPMILNQRWLPTLPEGNEGVTSDPLLPEEQPEIPEQQLG